MVYITTRNYSPKLPQKIKRPGFVPSLFRGGTKKNEQNIFSSGRYRINAESKGEITHRSEI